jgi:hypothetical protein
MVRSAELMARGWISTFLVLIALTVLAGFLGCSKDAKTGPVPPPKAPETELTYAPLEGDTSSFRVHFFWNGYDDDGEVVRFRYALDGDTSKPFSEWIPTTAKDTTLLFLVDPVKEIRGHVFWIVSEDNEGRFDPTPAKRFFSAKTLPPFSHITRGPNAPGTIIGPNFTFEWEGTDPDGGETGGPAPVDSFEYLLLQDGTNAEAGHPPLRFVSQQDYIDLINQATGPTLPAPYDDWKWVGIRGTRKRFRNVTPGHYIFAERAVDIAGATEKNLRGPSSNLRNIIDFNVTNKNPGPQLEACASVLVQCLPATSGSEDIVRREIQIFEGETISFSWHASGETYGGEIVGYTFALDDTASAEWGSIDILKNGVTLTPRQLTEGPHFLFIRAVDDGGLVTNMKIPLRIVAPRFKDSPVVGKPKVLYVDDFAPPPGDWPTALRGSPNFPTDHEQPSQSQEDIWWNTVILNPLAQEFGFELVGQQDSRHDTVYLGYYGSIDGRPAFTPDDLADYRVIIWYVDFNNTGSSPTSLWRTLVGGSYSELAGYLRAGGTLILTGFQIASQTSGRTDVPNTNFTQGMCAALDEGSPNWRLSYFARDFMGIDGALASDDALRSNSARDFVEARVTAAGSAMGFVTAELDVGGPGTGAKWNPFAFPGPAEISLAPGLPKIEGWKMQTNFGCFPPNIRGLVRQEHPGEISVPIFTYHGVPQGVLMDGGPSRREGLIVGIATQAHDLGNSGVRDSTITFANSGGVIGRMVVLGFPMYYMKDAQAYAIMRSAFAYVNASPTLPSYTP